METNREIIELKKRLIHFDEVIKMTQNLNSELQRKNENMEIENRTLEEDYHTLKDNYENLKKRFEQLQKEILDIKTNSAKKSSMFDWIMNNSVKDENQMMKDKIVALESELHLKIQENEQIHIEIFEEKQNFDRRITDSESEIEKMKIIINDKVGELNSINENNSNLVNVQRSLEKNLNSISENLRKTENDLKAKSSKWKNKKNNFVNELEIKNKIEKNLIPINDYKNENLNVYNLEYLNLQTFFEDFFIPTFKFFSNGINSCLSIITQVDTFMEFLIERFNYIYTNIDLKTEHRGYLFSCDKLRFHSFTLQQIFRTMFIFGRLLIKRIEHFEKSTESSQSQSHLEMNIILSTNIILTLLNKSSKYIELLTKYYKILLKEERKISYSEILDNASKMKINKDFKTSLSVLSSNLSLLVKKLNLLMNYDLDYNLKHIQIISDNSSGILIKVSTNYFTDFKYNSNIKLSQKFNLLENVIKNDFSLFKRNFSEFVKSFLIKTEMEYKIFEIIKEENKNKYNYPIINLSAFKLNNENVRKSINHINELIIKFGNLLNVENNYNILNLFGIKSWEISKSLFIPYLTIYERREKMRNFSSDLIKTYNSNEKGVDYEEAIRNKAILKEMLEKENMLSRDRENYLNKINEYEEDLKRFRDLLNQEKNDNDLLRMEMLNKKDNSSNLQTLSDSVIDNQSTASNEFEEFLKNQLNISEIKYEILSDDVQSGKQRSTFKLSNPQLDKAIPLTKFTAQIENNQDVTVMYHRKILEKLQRYASKVKSTDTRILSGLHLDEMKNEYEGKIEEIRKQYDEELAHLNQVVKTKEDHIFGYTQTIQFLNESFTELELLKENIKDCVKCNKFITN